MRNESNTGRPTIGSTKTNGDPNGPENGKNANSIWLAMAAVLSVLILALAILNFQKYGVFGDDAEATEEAAAPKTSADDSPNTFQPTQGTSEDQFPDSSQLQALAKEAGSPWVVGHQEQFMYRISGSVPSEEIKTSISTSVTETYGDDPDVVKNELTVDPSLSTTEWLNSAPAFLKDIPFTLIDGAFAINDETTNLSGLAESQTSIDTIIAAAETAGLPEVDSSITVADLRPPTIIATATNGKLQLLGTVPSERLADAIIADSADLFGEGNVEPNLAVDPTTFARFVLSRFGEVNLATFYPLGDFSMRLEQGELSASVDGGVVFPAGSAEVSEAAKSKLSGFPGFFNRANRPVFVFGHTDNTGDPTENKLLSQQRADAVKAFFVESGVETEKITAEGKGEENPIVPNDTPEGQAKNRRVEIKIGGA